MAQLSKQQAHKCLEQACSQFRTFFEGKNYQHRKSALMSSGIDPTVRFVGSHMNTLKADMNNRDIHSPIYIVQPCLKTKNISSYEDPHFYPRYGSYYMSLGLLAPANCLEQICLDTHEYLLSCKSIHDQNISYLVSSSDTEMLTALKRSLPKGIIHVDTLPEHKYDHQYGINRVSGRVIRVMLQNDSDKEAEMIAVIALLTHEEEGHLFTEATIGIASILKLTENLSNVMDVYPLSPLGNSCLHLQVEDILVATIELYQEGLRPSNKHNRNRILKKYIKHLFALCEKLQLTPESIKNRIVEYEASTGQQETISATLIEDLFKAK